MKCRASSVIRWLSSCSCSSRIGRSVSAVTRLTLFERTFPPRSTSEKLFPYRNRLCQYAYACWRVYSSQGRQKRFHLLQLLTFTTHRGSLFAGSHSITNPMGHKPSRFVGNTNGAMKLMATHAFLAAAKQIGC